MTTSSRSYEKTHPHITFKLDLKRPRAHELIVVYLTKGALATTAIEGNTLSEDEARKVVEQESTLPPSKQYLGREIQNVIAAYNQIKDELLADPSIRLSPERLNRYNASILEGLDVPDHVVPGKIRSAPVVVGNVYKAPEHGDCHDLLQRLCDWLNSDDFEAPRDAPEYRAPLAIIKAIVAHLYLAWIHPYGDGNGRTARLLQLQVLLAAGFPPPVTQLLSNHYNATRTEYYRQLKRAVGSS